MPNSSALFKEKRVLITQSDRLMGPALSHAFETNGAALICDTQDYALDPMAPETIVSQAGRIDVLIVNLAPQIVGLSSVETTDERTWQMMFDEIVHPTMRFVKAVLPQMIDRREGKIIVVSSAIPMKPSSHISTYAAARGAQNAYVKAAGTEAAEKNVQINAVGQNWVIGGYPEDYMKSEKNRKRVEREVPAKRLAEGWEQAELVMFLASPNSNFISGQVIPFCGGWVG